MAIVKRSAAEQQGYRIIHTRAYLDPTLTAEARGILIFMEAQPERRRWMNRASLDPEGSETFLDSMGRLEEAGLVERGQIYWRVA